MAASITASATGVIGCGCVGEVEGAGHSQPLPTLPLSTSLVNSFQCHAKGKIVLSGPFMEGPGIMAAGGMTIFRAADLAEATALGTDDPTVKSGMLKAEVKPWWVPFHD